MSDIIARIEGFAARLTLNRSDALNAITYDMCLEIETHVDQWKNDPKIAVIILDGTGDRAFCAGGDITAMYETALTGNFEYGRRFWADEYRLNAKLATCPTPIVSFLHGFTMGGGVGLGCHVSHRIVCENSQIAMPECAIGLVPDVGGSLLLARAPGRLGEYLGTTATRMGPADAIFIGFADYYIPQNQWPHLIKKLCLTGNLEAIINAHSDPGVPKLLDIEDEVNTAFSGEFFSDIVTHLENSDTVFSTKTLKKLSKPSPLAMASTIEMIHRVRGLNEIVAALEMEYRFTYRSAEQGDFIEGIRALVIDKDRNPKWKHKLSDTLLPDSSAMLRPLGQYKLDLSEKTMKIGFIGLGNMGSPMATNLTTSGHEVLGFDITNSCPDGVAQVTNAAAVAAGADVVITMLPNGTIAKSVAAEVLSAMAQGSILLDCSTIDVTSAREIAQMADGHGVGFLDAPVSGGVAGAVAGSLTFMVGGSDKAFRKARPLFEIMGQKSVHCGPAGNGQAAKICNNMILGITMIGTCEAFALADKLGLDRQAMFDVVSTSSGYSWTMNAYCPAPGIGPSSPADNDYRPGFSADLMLKDLRLSQQAATEADADTPMGAAATALYEAFVEHEDGAGRDFSAMLPRFENRSRK